MRVLLIDDNPQIRTIIQRIVEALGHQIVLAEDGTSGLDAARSGPFDLMLIDLELPDMDGFAVSRQMAAMGMQGKRFALSAHPLDRVEEERALAGFAGSLTKPIDLAALSSLLNQ